METPALPRFLADCMLAKVARWLVLLGYDAAYATAKEHEDHRLLSRAQAEGRIFLTRDTRIPPVSGVRMIVIREQRFEDQLQRVIQETGLRPDPARFFTRCTLCNRGLRKVRREDVLSRLPEKVRAMRTSFFICAGCGRIYWSGSHVQNAVRTLRRIGALP